ncbi:hypothetical protein [Pseudoalteromonas sp. MMG005]|uniref:hypothetical protein n=1 Tax=Pseudoalteromonas sp. MMG005 TaxID=2822682 RepID=UPI001B3A3E76|nr:hypothetical protein [Pseudoalteromonas sp. MMG005]MBQ4848443.1 hypothetical protein [Pseudoalteromonas sp. MMG005]
MDYRAGLGTVSEYATQVGKNLVNGESIGDALTNIDGKEIVASGLGGAVGASGLKVINSAISGVTKAGKVDSKAARSVRQLMAAPKLLQLEQLKVQLAEITLG